MYPLKILAILACCLFCACGGSDIKHPAQTKKTTVAPTPEKRRGKVYDTIYSKLDTTLPSFTESWWEGNLNCAQHRIYLKRKAQMLHWNNTYAKVRQALSLQTRSGQVHIIDVKSFSQAQVKKLFQQGKLMDAKSICTFTHLGWL